MSGMTPHALSGPPDGNTAHQPVLSESVRPNYVGIGFLVSMIVMGGAYTVMAFGYGLSAERNPMGPGAAPAVLGLLLITGCLFVLGQEFRSYRRARAANREEGEQEEAGPPAARELVKPLMIVLVLLAGLMLAPVVGMTISMTAVVIVIALVVEKVKLLPSLIMGAVSALMLWGIFQQVLNVRFPDSLIGF